MMEGFKLYSYSLTMFLGLFVFLPFQEREKRKAGEGMTVYIM